MAMITVATMAIQIASRAIKAMIMTVMRGMATMIMTIHFTLGIQNSGS